MTNPLGNAGAGSPPVVSVGGGGGGGGLLPLILRELQFSRERKQRQAETSLGLTAQGTAFGSLTPEGQKQVERATGRKWSPEEVVNPLPIGQDEATVKRLLGELNIGEDSPLGIGFLTGLAKRTATGAASDLSTPTDLSVEQETISAGQRARRSEAKATESMAGSFESAQGKIKSGIPLTDDELVGMQKFAGFVPSQPIADQLSGQARGKVMQEALRMVSDPETTTLAKALAPFGVSAADAIGSFALGVGDMLQTAISRKAAIDIATIENRGKLNELAAKALFGTAEEISKRMGGAFSPAFIASVMEGDPKALATDAGKLVQRFSSSGYHTALTELATKGDPASLAMSQLLEISRIPQIASNEKLLAQYSNLAQEALASTLTRTYTGVERPTEPGEQQAMWDATQQAMRRKTAGVFAKDYWLGIIPRGMQITPEGPAADVTRQAALPEAQKRRMADEQIITDVLKAVLDSSNVRTIPDTVQQGAAR